MTGGYKCENGKDDASVVIDIHCDSDGDLVC
jgi:hypothetical protein